MKTDQQLADDVRCAIHDEPMFMTAELFAVADNGVVTLAGSAPHFGMKGEAMHIALKVTGVQRVIENIEIRLHLGSRRSDHEIMSAISEAFRNSWQFSAQFLKFEVDLGIITIRGELPWDYQRKAVFAAVNNLVGVRGVNIFVILAPVKVNTNIRADIMKAFVRNLAYPEKTAVEVRNNLVLLKGSVESTDENLEAERLSWNVAGVLSVVNELQVAQKPLPESENIVKARSLTCVALA